MRLSLDYREILRQEYAERCQRNARYSLRAFARDLAIDSAFLSRVLNNKKGLSRVTALAIAHALNWDECDAEIFCDLVESRHARNLRSRELALERVRKRLNEKPVNVLSLAAFSSVSDWYHFAILQVMKLDDFVDDAEWIAKRLGITAQVVTDALVRMREVGLIELTDGRHQPTGAYVLSPDGVPSESVRKVHEQMLRKALYALHSAPIDKRDFSAMLMPVCAEDLGKARKKIRAFTRELCRELSSAPTVNQVYCFSAQFFDVGDGGNGGNGNHGEMGKRDGSLGNVGMLGKNGND